MANISEKIKSKQNKIGKMIDKRKEKNNIIKTYFESTPLLSVDIENTLVPKKRRIFLVNKEDRKSIKNFAQKGGVVLINSGGTYGYCKKVAKSAKVKTIISSNNGAFVAIPEQTDRPIISLRVSPENIYRIKDKLEQVEPRAIIALSGKDRKYYIDNKGAKIRLFQMQQAFKFRNRYRISTNKKKFEDMALKTYSIQIFPMPDTYGLTKNTKPIKKEQQKNNSAPAFKGRGINNEGIFSKFGKFLTKRVPEKAQELLEYTGYNFSKTTFAGLSIFGLLVPRGKRAWDRAQIDENGKRDLTELHEIILRDTVSSLSVVFAVPCLTKLIVSLYEDKTGFILTNRASDGKNFFKKALDILWPCSNLEVLSVADLDSIYGNIDSKTKLLNFSKFVNEKGGDLEKILSKSENASLMFNEKSFTLNSIKHLSKEEKNKKIISEFEKLNNADELISKLMKGTGELKNNRIAKMARGLNSIPGVLSTVLISPIILGILIPKLTYHNTRRTHAKRLQAQNQSTQLKTYNS